MPEQKRLETRWIGAAWGDDETGGDEIWKRQLVATRFEWPELRRRPAVHRDDEPIAGGRATERDRRVGAQFPSSDLHVYASVLRRETSMVVAADGSGSQVPRNTRATRGDSRFSPTCSPPRE